jgi:hypothetical protein
MSVFQRLYPIPVPGIQDLKIRPAGLLILVSFPSLREPCLSGHKNSFLILILYGKQIKLKLST